MLGSFFGMGIQHELEVLFSQRRSEHATGRPEAPTAPWVVPSLALPGHMVAVGMETWDEARQRSKLEQGEAGVSVGQQPGPGCPLHLGSR